MVTTGDSNGLGLLVIEHHIFTNITCDFTQHEANYAEQLD